MTNEEAIKRLKDGAPFSELLDVEWEKAINMAIKALETVSCIKEKCAYCPHCENCDVDDETLEIKALNQQPCEDCISRSKVLEGKVIHQSCDGVEIINSYAVPVEYIEQLLPVTPKEKTWKIGKWIEGGYDDMYYVCSECDYKASEYWHKPSYKYCPNCGAKMVEPQESEVSE